MSRKPNIEKLQAQCDAFNATCAVGGRVSVQLDGGEIRETVTTSEAQILSGHSAVIWLKGVSGCYLLDRVTTVKRRQLDHNPFTHTKAALLEFEAGEPARQRAWDDIYVDEDLRKAEAADKAALDKVRMAFYEDTKEYNAAADCLILKIDFMRKCADGTAVVGSV